MADAERELINCQIDQAMCEAADALEELVAAVDPIPGARKLEQCRLVVEWLKAYRDRR